MPCPGSRELGEDNQICRTELSQKKNASRRDGVRLCAWRAKNLGKKNEIVSYRGGRKKKKKGAELLPMRMRTMKRGVKANGVIGL